MTCENCNCKKPAPKKVATEPRRYYASFKYARDFMVAAIAALLVWGIVTYGPTLTRCDHESIELRISALEKHSIRVDSQFHKSLK